MVGSLVEVYRLMLLLSLLPQKLLERVITLIS